MHRNSVGLTAAAATGAIAEADLQPLDPVSVLSPDATPVVAGRKDVDPPTMSAVGPSEFDFNNVDIREQNLLTGTFMRFFCTSKWFLVVLCVFVLFQSLIVSGLSAGTVSSIQTRYHIDSTTMGVINAFYDMVVSVSVPLVSYYGGHGHTPRVLGIGMFLVGLGSIITAFPQFMEGKYNLLDDRTLVCTTTTLQQNCVGSNDAVVAVLFIGQLVIGVGAAGVYTLGPAYLDKIFSRQEYPVAVGVFYAIGALGPALGFIISGSFLKTWVDLGDPPVSDLKPEDPEWVGAWWLPYLFVGVICSALSSLLLMYPQYVPNTKYIRTDNKRHARELEKRLLRLQNEQFGTDDESTRAMEEHLNRRHDWKAQTRSMLHNKAYLFNNLGQACDGFTVSALATFMPKIAQSLFNLTASNASFTVGLVSIPGAVGGTLASGLLLKRFKVSPKNQGKVLIGVQVLAIIFCTFVALGCPTATIVGVNAPWTNEPDPSIDNACNSACHCNPDKYNPICGSDGRTYFSACFAGCTNRTADQQRYGQCGCLGDSLKEAKKNKCSGDCNTFGPFLVLLFLAMFFTFMAVVPAVAVLVRSLPFQERPLGLAYQNATYRWIGTIPSPPIMGAAIDKACFLFAVSCGKELGDCLEYDSVQLRRNIAALVFVPKAIAICCYIASLRSFNRVYPDEADIKDLTDVPSPGLGPSASPSTDALPRPLVAPAL